MVERVLVDALGPQVGVDVVVVSGREQVKEELGPLRAGQPLDAACEELAQAVDGLLDRADGLGSWSSVGGRKLVSDVLLALEEPAVGERVPRQLLADLFDEDAPFLDASRRGPRP